MTKPQRPDLGPKQLAWCDEKWPVFRDMRLVTLRHQEELDQMRHDTAAKSSQEELKP